MNELEVGLAVCACWKRGTICVAIERWQCLSCRGVLDLRLGSGLQGALGVGVEVECGVMVGERTDQANRE